MSHPNILCTDSTSEVSLPTKETQPFEEILQKIIFVDKEKEQRQLANKQYHDNQILKKIETISQHQIGLAIEKKKYNLPLKLGIGVFNHLSDEINSIIKLNPNEQISEASWNFCWVKAVEKNKKSIL